MSGEREAGRNKAAAKKPAEGAPVDGARADDGAKAPTERVGELASNALNSGETIFREASQLVATVRAGQSALGERISSGSQASPYVAVATAASVGFVLGGGLTIGITRRLVALGTRLAVSMVIRKVVENASSLQA